MTTKQAAILGATAGYCLAVALRDGLPALIAGDLAAGAVTTLAMLTIGGGAVWALWRFDEMPAASAPPRRSRLRVVRRIVVLRNPEKSPGLAGRSAPAGERKRQFPQAKAGTVARGRPAFREDERR